MDSSTWSGLGEEELEVILDAIQGQPATTSGPIPKDMSSSTWSELGEEELEVILDAIQGQHAATSDPEPKDMNSSTWSESGKKELEVILDALQGQHAATSANKVMRDALFDGTEQLHPPKRPSRGQIHTVQGQLFLATQPEAVANEVGILASTHCSQQCFHPHRDCWRRLVLQFTLAQVVRMVIESRK